MPEAVVRVLIEAGIDMVFGVPAGNSTRIFNALADHTSTIRTVLVREESLAGVMAEVYGRMTGRPGVVIGQSAFIITNALLGTLEGHLSSSPMVLIGDLTDDPPYSHHGPYQVGTGEYGGFDAKQILSGTTKMAAVAYDPGQFVQQVQLGLKHAMAGKPGPVAVLFSSGAINAVVGPATRPTLYSTDRYSHAAVRVDRTALARAVAALRAARRPVIIAGNGVRLSRAYEQLQRLAVTLDAPVATTAGGKGVFNEFDPLALGVLGNFGTSLANGAVAGADLIVVVGSKLGPNDTANEHSDLINPARQNLIQIDVEPQNAAWTFPADDVIVGDAADVLAALHDELTALGLPVREEPSKVWLAALTATLSVGESDRIGATSDGRIDPRELIEQLVATLPPTAIVCCDAGENRIFMTHYFRSRGGGAFLQPSGTGGMGYAIPAALSTQLVFPDRTSVAVCGDGGFAMAMNGMLTAVEVGIPIVVVVLNNSALGWVRHGQGDRPIASELGEFDYAAIARAIGCIGVRVESLADLGAALEVAMLADRPTVVDVVTSMDLTFRDVTSHLAMATSIE